jgi:hypothetical protein
MLLICLPNYTQRAVQVYGKRRSMVINHDGVYDTRQTLHGENEVIAHIERLRGPLGFEVEFLQMPKFLSRLAQSIAVNSEIFVIIKANISQPSGQCKLEGGVLQYKKVSNTIASNH